MLRRPPQKKEFVKLPFHSVEESIHAVTVLSSTYNLPDKVKRASINFQLSNENIQKCMSKKQDSLPRYEIQFRIGAFQRGSGQIVDQFPDYFLMRLNNTNVPLPPTKKVKTCNGTVENQCSSPVNLSLQCIRRNNYVQKLVIDWKADNSKVFMIGIWLVHHIPSSHLHQQFISNGVRHYNETKQMIIKMLSGSQEDDVSMDSFRVSLICPLSRVRMTTPVRSKECNHVQCFDLSNYLQLNELKSTWKCPICSKACVFDSLVYDRYTSDIIESIDAKTTEVDLQPDGSWRKIEKLVTLIDISLQPTSPVLNPTATSFDSSGYGTALRNPSPRNEDGENNVITLGDSEDDEIIEIVDQEVESVRSIQSPVQSSQLSIQSIESPIKFSQSPIQVSQSPILISHSPNSSSQSPNPLKRTYNQVRSSLVAQNKIEVITLSDSDEE